MEVDLIEVTVRCGCTRVMRVDGRTPGRYRCGCGAGVTLSGLPKFDATHCQVPRKGNRICNGRKLPDDIVCEPCSITIASIGLSRPTIATRLAEGKAYAEFHRIEQGKFDQFQDEKRERAEAVRLRLDALKVCVVYYVQLKPGIIKIGTSTDLDRRMDAFRADFDDVLAAEPGSYTVERLRHKQFGHLRIHHKREDFRLADDLQAHMDALMEIHGSPWLLVGEIREKQLELAKNPPSELTCAKVE